MERKRACVSAYREQEQVKVISERSQTHEYTFQRQKTEQFMSAVFFFEVWSERVTPSPSGGSPWTVTAAARTVHGLKHPHRRQFMDWRSIIMDWHNNLVDSSWTDTSAALTVHELTCPHALCGRVLPHHP
eukprot:3860362-Rhodomonas_salina.1